MEHQTRVGVGVMIFKDGKVLLGKRKVAHGEGEYAFPGGHLEYMESFETCARRETDEECGITIDNIQFQLLGNVTQYAPKHYVHLTVTADWAGGVPAVREPDRIESWDWYNLDNLPQPLFEMVKISIESRLPAEIILTTSPNMLQQYPKKIRCILHGSFQKHFDELQRVHQLFTEAGIEVVAPAFSTIRTNDQGFAFLESDTTNDKRRIELEYLHHLKRLGRDGFSYFVNPGGYIGKSTSYELGIAQLSNIPCFFEQALDDHPAYIAKNTIWQPELLAAYIAEHHTLPPMKIRKNDQALHQLWTDLMVPGSVVAVGGIIEHDSLKKEKEILLVKTHKWNGRYSIVGGRVHRNELLDTALGREIHEETGLRASIKKHICTFDQLKSSGYYLPGVQHIFVDKVARVGSKKVILNNEAEGYLWITPRAALAELDIEPNARLTLRLYNELNRKK